MAKKKAQPETAPAAAPQFASKQVPAKGRAHVATYARDKRKGGYLIRIAGPHAAEFAGQEVPVTRMDRTESKEMLKALIWSGPDQETGEPVALYSFEARPREEQDAGAAQF